MSNPIYPWRFLARVVLEAATPLAVGSGTGNMLTDSLVVTDVNGLPYIPGTSLAGVLRHLCPKNDKLAKLFGYAEGDKGHGSQIIISEARMIGKDGKVQDGLRTIDADDSFYSYYFNLPVRQHARIDSRGVTEKGGKFDNQVVYKGTRFCFELEMVAKESDKEKLFKQILSYLNDGLFRLGGGVHEGLGEVKVVSCRTKVLDLHKPEDVNFYAAKSSSLAGEWKGDEWMPDAQPEKANVRMYKLELQPEDFFLFGSGFGDADADMTYVKENVVDWDQQGIPHFVCDKVLVPASSVKGALAHRTAYWYNKLKGWFADKHEGKSGNENEAVRQIFGYNDGKDDSICQKGHIYLSDVFLNEKREHVFPHVAIDRFTGGAMDSALFSEKTVYGKGLTLSLVITLDTGDIEDEDIIKAFEHALDDVCAGLLPLGGGVNRGNGIFTGCLTKLEKVYEETESDNA